MAAQGDDAGGPPRARGGPGAYIALCAALGLALGWLPILVHGPIPQKFNVLYIQGAIAIWAFYSARLLVGFVVGISVWPRAWYLRGPLCGFLTLLPVTFIALATPQCGFT